MAADVGGLIADVGLNVAGLRQDVQRANGEMRRGTNRMNRHLGKMRKSVGRVGSALKGLVAVAGLGMLASRIRGVVDSVDELGKAANTADVTAESLQELRFAFGQLADVTDQQVDQALQRFTRRLGLAVDGTGAASGTFEELNIRMTDLAGNTRDTERVLDDALVALDGIESGSERAARASELFGDRVGPRLASALGEGSQSLDEMREKAHELGIVLSEEAVDSAADLNDQFDIMSRTITTQLSQTILENSDAIQNLAGAIGTVASVATAGIASVVDFTHWIGEELAAAIHGPAADDIPRLERELEKVNKRLANPRDLTSKQFDELSQKAQALEIRLERARAAMDQPMEITITGRGGIRAGVQMMEAFGLATDQARTHMEGMTKEAQTFMDTLDPFQRGSLRAFQSNLKTLEEYAEEWGNVTPKIREAAEETDNLNNKTQRTDRVTRRLQMTFSSAFEDAIIAGEGLRSVLRGIAQDIARIMIRQSVTEPAGQALAGAFAGAFGGGSIEARADGGPVRQGSSYLVGERGPEVFSPGRSGTITPNEAISGGGSTTVNNNFTISADGADPTQVARLTDAVRALDRTFERRAVASIQDAQSRGRMR